MKPRGTWNEVKDVDPNEVLTPETRAHIDHWLGKFPPDRKRSALIQALFVAQEQNGGFLEDRHIQAVAYYLDIPPVWAYEVATFYSMLETKPVGRHNVAICTNISCWLNGAGDLVKHCEKKLGIRLGESTPDGRIYLKREEECVAGCCGAPVMLVDGNYHDKVTPEQADAIFDKLD